jgi:hypothetical protein
MVRQRKNLAMNRRFKGRSLHASRPPHESVATNPLARAVLIRDMRDNAQQRQMRVKQPNTKS